MSARHLILAALLTAVSIIGRGQDALCDSLVPVFQVDLSEDPYGIWLSPDIRREGLCCDNYWPDRCVEFVVTLHPSAVGLIFDIEVGAEPPGALFYTINCGPEIPVGELACLQGNGPHYVTFCKPGANRNIYSIQSIPGRIVPDTAVVVEGCDIDLGVDGLVESSITWTDITSGTGTYEDLLSCTAGCDSTTFSSTLGLPDFISYRVCGTLVNPICDLDTAACDTVVVQVLREMQVEITPIDEVACSGVNEATLDAILTGDYNNPVYQWYTIQNNSTVWLGNDASQDITGSGTYGVIVSDADFPDCRSGTDEIIVNFGTTPVLVVPPDASVCEDESISLTASGAEIINWYTSVDTICSGCHSITHTFTEEGWVYVQGINLSGCEAIDSFYVSLLPSYSQTQTDSICESEAYVLPDGNVVYTAGSYSVTLTADNGCDSVIVTDLTVIPSVITTVYDSICEGDIYILPDGTEITAAGAINDTSLTAFGCDSVIQTVLTILPSYYLDIDLNLCGGDDYMLPDSSVVDTAGHWSFSFTTAAGCDSIYDITLSTYPKYEIIVRDTICDVDYYELPGGALVNEQGVYVNFYEAQGGCDSIITTYLTVHPSNVEVIMDTICAGEDYILPDGTIIETAGGVADSFVTSYGCDSVVQVVLTLMPRYSDTVQVVLCGDETHTLPDGSVINTSGTWIDTLNTAYGCDSIIATIVEAFSAYDSTIEASICAGSSYTLPSGTVVTTSGTYADVYTSLDGCDSTITTELTVLDAWEIEVRDTICDYESYTLPNGMVVSMSGIWIHNFPLANGCDSIITTYLTVLPSTVITVRDTLCEGEGYILPDGSVLTAGGEYIDTLTTYYGCDSIVQSIIYILLEYDLTVDAAICSGEAYILPDGTPTNIAGSYTHALTTNAGCDSVIHTNLTVVPEYDFLITATICDVETYILPDGSTATASGTYIDSLQATAGCDSVITTVLTMIPSTVYSVYDTICEGDIYTMPDGSVITASGQYIDSMFVGFGCDSVININVTVLPSYHETIVASTCNGEDHVLPDGTVVTGSGTYVTSFTTHMGCDSIFTTIFTASADQNLLLIDTICSGQPYTLPDDSVVYFSGIYTDSLISTNGCDSVVTVDLTVLESINYTVEVSLCEGETYVLPDGSEIIVGSDPIDTISVDFGCDSVINTVFHVWPIYDTLLQVELCPGENHELPDGSIVSGAGTHVITLPTWFGCDSVITTEIMELEFETFEFEVSICDGDSYTLPDGSSTGTAGTYSHTFINTAGCDSLVIVTLDVLPRSTSFINAVICEGDSYQLPGGTTVASAGVYVNILTAFNGCDSLITTDLQVYQVEHPVVDASICEGENYTLPDGSTVNTSGTYQTILTAGPNCDSVITTILTVLPTYASQVNAVICPGDVYELPGGNTVNDAGTYTDILTSSEGCDSVITTVITIMPLYEETVSASICEGDEYQLPNGEFVSTSSTYTNSFTSTALCDSVIITELAVLPVYTNSTTYQICEGDTIKLPDGTPVSVDTTIIYSHNSSGGCDSTTTYTIDVSPTTEYEFDYVVCGEPTVTIGDFTYTESGIYYIYSTNHFGCDSIAIMNLEMNVPFEDHIDTFLCPGVPVIVAGQSFSTPGDYVVVYTNTYGCDSTYYVGIEYANEPEVIVREDTTVLAGSEVEAYIVSHSNRDLQFNWFVNDTLVHTNVKRFTASYMEESVVRVAIRDTNDCQSQDEFRVFVETDCPDDLIFAPNIISPNNDNANDVFRILNPYDVYIDEVVIFNRWGERVYHARDFTDPWDGTFRGQPCNPDVYTYFIQGTCISGSKILKKGNITLIR